MSPEERDAALAAMGLQDRLAVGLGSGLWSGLAVGSGFATLLTLNLTLGASLDV